MGKTRILIAICWLINDLAETFGSICVCIVLGTYRCSTKSYFIEDKWELYDIETIYPQKMFYEKK